ncbi:putative frequency clock protein [Erysiphe necator]|uniref:Putative frequency clock protein n=1 Tax=Uncinula necator TaxID=52586 RepID=A0A0B1P4J1_UNCNE|nr:putative frequency clock protein [Erysiphe necator]
MSSVRCSSVSLKQKASENSQNKDQSNKKQALKPCSKSTQLLSDLAVILDDVQAPLNNAPSQENASVSENSSLSRLSDENCSISEDYSTNLHKWFDDFNRHPEKTASKYRDTGSPYFLQQNLTTSSRFNSEIAQIPDANYSRRTGSTDDYRSVIDDLTIENKRLRKKLRRFKKLSSKQLEKDKLFEIKIHDLPPAKRRELESALHSFASSIDFSSCGLRSSEQSLGQSQSPEETSISKKKSSTSSSINSNLEQSSYDSAIMSTLLTTVNSEPNIFETEKSTSLNPGFNTCESQSYVKPPCSEKLSKYSIKDMSDRQKKKLVVQRLEQIFTGEKAAVMGMPHQSLNKDETSKQTHENEHLMNYGRVREAHMIPQENYSYSRPIDLLDNSETKTSSHSSDETNSNESFSNQRPTRLRELDPDRTQIPSDNVEYIRHLGLSTPQLANDESEDGSKEKGGWVYLNLLINMAQLHIINVTPDFVRSALVDVSEKIELSKDGQMLRWKGGSLGTNLHNDDSSSGKLSCHSSKRKGSHVYKSREKTEFPARRINSSALNEPHPSLTDFHYKPLFFPRVTPEQASESDESPSGPSLVDESICSQDLWCQPRKSRPLSCSIGKRQEDGSLVFYRGADFCVDLSGDPESTTQLSTSILEQDSEGEQNLSEESHSPIIERTSSGSLLPFRPFKDPKSLDLRSIEDPNSYQSSENSSNCQLELSRFPTETHQGPIVPQALQPCGIGGSQISDHFEIHVLTQHSVTSANNSDNNYSTSNNIERKTELSSPEQKAESLPMKTLEDRVNDQVASRGIKSLSLISSSQKVSLTPPSQVQSKIISSETVYLPPSKLPSPATLQYSSDSDLDLDYNVG